MRAIFLDIDGVMHGVDKLHVEYTSSGIQYSGEGLFEHRDLLGSVLDQCPDVAVIISSSWRHIYTLSELQGFFGNYSQRVIGTTSSVDVRDSMPANRYRECRDAAERYEVSDWVMVDDQPGIVWSSQIPTPELARKVLWCDPVLGLATPFVTYELVKRFGSTSPNRNR